MERGWYKVANVIVWLHYGFVIYLIFMLFWSDVRFYERLTRLSTFETKASVLRGLLFAFLNYQIKVFTTPLRMPFAPLPS